jgi:hypothetical protein
MIQSGIIGAVNHYSLQQLLQLAVAMRRMDLQEMGAHPHDSVDWGCELEELHDTLEHLDREEQVEQAARGELARLNLAVAATEHLSDWISIAEEMGSEVQA